MEFYLIVRDTAIDEARFWTDGCEATRACGEFAARFVEGNTVDEAMRLSPAHILDALPELHRRDRHCAILSTMTLYKAIADYVLKP